MSEDWKKSNHDVEDLSKILDTVSEKIPALIKALKDTLYSEDAGRELGKAVGAFYKELVSNGFSQEDAMNMTKTYLSSLQSAMKGVNFGQHKEN